MKVICIDVKPRPDSNNDLAELAKLKEGNTYTVVRICANSSYTFKEVKHKHDPYSGWLQGRFIPISDIDETEFVREYNKGLA